MTEQNKPCPFCGSEELKIVDWWDDDGCWDGIECCNCKASALAKVWNKRAVEDQ